MIAILGRTDPPDEGVARQALAAVPYGVPDVTLRRLGSCLLGIALQPDLPDGSVSAEGPLIAALDGRLDNAVELHQECLTAGMPPASSSDADVVVAAFRQFGPDVVNRFRGAFAGAVTDGRSLWAFRDHVGFRVLFYRDDPGQFILANDAKSVLAAAQLPAEPDFEVLEAIFFGGLPSHTPSALKGASRVPQGMVLTTGMEPGVTWKRYWHPKDLLETGRFSPDEARERFLVLLEQAVKRSVTGRDVLFLSGGLDSPAVAAYAAPEHLRRTGRPLGAMAVVFPDLPAVDERPFIELVAQRHGMELHTYSTSARALDDVEEWARRLGTPVPMLSIPEVWEAYQRARALGYRNVLTGEFAELTYGKFPHQLAHLVLRGRFRAAYEVMKAEHLEHGASRRELLQEALTAFVPGRIVNWWLAIRGRNAMHKVLPWLAPSRYNKYVSRHDYMVPARDRWNDLQLYGTSGSTITMDADATCAAMAGVTIRRPLADIDLWEFFLSLRAEVKFPVLQWKALARQALRGVIPDEILDRPRKTLFDDHVMRQVDYPTLERLLVRPTYRMKDVNYDVLAERIERRELGFHEWLRARELARIHAFVNTL
ncbi:MAG TPA: asparagine synthase-related protein [Gemmatimonadaceae bacterium]|nr:asparagine synthase-related protein [Gemmatimonadaceae bacterium]